MAYSKADKDRLLKKAIKAAKDEELHFIEDVVAILPINKTTFYNWKFDENNELKEILETNKISLKRRLRCKWEQSGNASLQIALYKLVATDQEREILNDNKTIKLEDMPDIVVNVK